MITTARRLKDLIRNLSKKKSADAPDGWQISNKGLFFDILVLTVLIK